MFLQDAASIAGARSYDSLGEVALGSRVGAIAVVTFIFLNNLGVCITFLCGFGDVVPQIVEANIARRGGHNHTHAADMLVDDPTSLVSFGPAPSMVQQQQELSHGNSTLPFVRMAGVVHTMQCCCVARGCFLCLHDLSTARHQHACR